MTESTPKAPDLARLSELAVFEKGLLDARSLLIFGEIDSALAERVSMQLLALAGKSAEPIRIFVNSQGGHVESADTLFDLIRFVQPEVTMIGSGWVASAGALIYCAASRERRLALPNTRFMLHEPSGGYGGQAADIEIQARQLVLTRARLNAIFAEATGHSVEAIARDTQRDHWMSAQEAQAYGLVGRIIERADEA